MDYYQACVPGLGAGLRPSGWNWTSTPTRGICQLTRASGDLTFMPVYKRKYRSGKLAWYYQFASSGSTRLDQKLITESGFPTKQEAIAAEAVRRTEEQKKCEMARAGAAGVAAAMPTSLAMLLAEFMKQHAEETLAPKTVERYHEMAAYLAPELLAMDMTAITPLHLSREWTRLLKCGGHTRKSKTPRAMKPKTEIGRAHV